MSQAPTTIPQDLLTNYASSGFIHDHDHDAPTRTLPFGKKPALLVIDVCNAYLTPGSPLYAPERFHSALKNIESLLETCRRKDISIIFTRVTYPSPESGGNWYKKLPKALSCFDAGNELGEFPTESAVCKPLQREVVIEKQFSSSFFGTPLTSVLVGMKVDSLIICGYSTSGCVRATVVDAMQYGFHPFVVGDACGDRHAYPHEANLFDIQAKFGEVLSMEEVSGLMGS
ncbi:hypothetical protein MMC28_004284 [Mycoblastus sanguinarius]|nr:hypothetical protein [Mycoblastus sanguinarius]